MKAARPAASRDQARSARRWALVAALLLLSVAWIRWADADLTRRVETLRLEERALRIQRDSLSERLRAATAPGPVGTWARANGFVPAAEAAQGTLRRVPDDRPEAPPPEPPVSLRTVIR